MSLRVLGAGILSVPDVRWNYWKISKRRWGEDPLLPEWICRRNRTIESGRGNLCFAALHWNARQESAKHFQICSCYSCGPCDLARTRRNIDVHFCAVRMRVLIISSNRASCMEESSGGVEIETQRLNAPNKSKFLFYFLIFFDISIAYSVSTKNWPEGRRNIKGGQETRENETSLLDECVSCCFIPCSLMMVGIIIEKHTLSSGLSTLHFH